jgi:hypothetical protein
MRLFECTFALVGIVSRSSLWQDVAMVASDAAIELSLLRLLKDCSEDNQDSVRLLTAGACAPLAARCLPKGGLAPVAEVFQRVVKDVSWRVRYMAAESITQVVRACVRACICVCVSLGAIPTNRAASL